MALFLNEKNVEEYFDVFFFLVFAGKKVGNMTYLEDILAIDCEDSKKSEQRKKNAPIARYVWIIKRRKARHKEHD